MLLKTETELQIKNYGFKMSTVLEYKDVAKISMTLQTESLYVKTNKEKIERFSRKCVRSLKNDIKFEQLRKTANPLK